MRSGYPDEKPPILFYNVDYFTGENIMRDRFIFDGNTGALVIKNGQYLLPEYKKAINKGIPDINLDYLR